VRLRTRNGNDWTRKFPSLYASVAKLKAKSVVLNLEAVVLDSTGKSSFQAMQQALGEGGNRQSIRGYVFRSTLPRWQGHRSPAAHSPPAGTNDLHYSDHVVGHGADMIVKSCSMGLEGIVSKLANSPYRAGRQESWVKAKCLKRQEFVIIGYTAARKGSRAIGALHLGYEAAFVLREGR
jgi:bifunctional non-homologous end joining protein LigD